MQLLKFTSEWCGPCKKLAPILDKLSAEYPDLSIQEIDIDRQPELAQQYRVRTLPTLIILNQAGEEANRLVGLASAQQIRALLNT